MKEDGGFSKLVDLRLYKADIDNDGIIWHDGYPMFGINSIDKRVPKYWKFIPLPEDLWPTEGRFGVPYNYISKETMEELNE